MKRIAVLAAVLLSGCALRLPPTCEEGLRLEPIRSDRGTEYLCFKPKEDR